MGRGLQDPDREDPRQPRVGRVKQDLAAASVVVAPGKVCRRRHERVAEPLERKRALAFAADPTVLVHVDVDHTGSRGQAAQRADGGEFETGRQGPCGLVAAAASGEEDQQQGEGNRGPTARVGAVGREEAHDRSRGSGTRPTVPGSRRQGSRTREAPQESQLRSGVREIRLRASSSISGSNLRMERTAARAGNRPGVELTDATPPAE